MLLPGARLARGDPPARAAPACHGTRTPAKDVETTGYRVDLTIKMTS